ncbi:MAG: M48 family metallopeptidase [Firmicutes bacterium]|nr:M48 family metallopeptidase [Bacillota bacterium]
MKKSILTINGQQLTLEHSPRLKKIHITMNPQDGIIVRVPVGCPRKRAEAVVKEHWSQLSTNLARIRKKCPRREYNSGQQIPLLDEQLSLQFGAGDAFQATLRDRTIFITPRKAEREIVRELVAGIYRQIAQDYMPRRVAYLNQRHFQFHYNQVKVRDQQSILGSCSGGRNLNINFRLLLAPVAVVDYVLLHELAHLQEMNHSPRFWGLVEGACPNYREHLHWLKENGMCLYI